MSRTLVGTSIVLVKLGIAICLTLSRGYVGALNPTLEHSSERQEAAEKRRSRQLTVLRGRFLLPSGSAAGGVKLHVRGWVANDELVEQYGLPRGWPDPVGKSEVDGRFELVFEPPRAYQFTLSAKLEGYAEASWRWPGMEAGSVLDVGEVTLRHAGTIVGQVVDATGNPLPVNWRIYAEEAADNRAFGRRGTRVDAACDPDTGSFRIEGLPPGPVQLEAYGKLVNWVEGPVVEVPADGELEALFRYTGPDPRRRIAVNFHTRFDRYDDPYEAVRLLRDGAEVARATKIESSSLSFAFDDLALGEYELVIEDPRFERKAISGLKPGQALDVGLKGNVTLSLAVIDAVTREEITNYRLEAGLAKRDGMSFSGRMITVRGQRKPPPKQWAYEGFVPVDTKLLVSAPGYVPEEIVLNELSAGESRFVTCELQPGQTVLGRVLERDGTAAVGAVIEIVAPDSDLSQINKLRDGWFMSSGDPRIATTRTDGQGQFEVRGIEAGLWHLLAVPRSGVETRVPIEVSSRVPTSLRIELAAPSSLEGRVILNSGSSTRGLIVSVQRPDRRGSPARGTGRFEENDSGELASDGSFRLDGLAAGEWIVLLEIQRQEPRGGLFSIPNRIELERLTMASGELLQREYKLRDREPGLLQVEVSCAHDVLANAAVEVVNRSPKERWRVRSRLSGSPPEIRELLFPGEYDVLVYSGRSSWYYVHPVPVTVLSGQTDTVQVSVELVDGELEVVEAETGEPLAGARVDWRLEALGHEVQGGLTTDENGILKGPMAPGTYHFFVWGIDKEPVTVEWGVNGPSPARVSLSKADF